MRLDQLMEGVVSKRSIVFFLVTLDLTDVLGKVDHCLDPLPGLTGLVSLLLKIQIQGDQSDQLTGAQKAPCHSSVWSPVSPAEFWVCLDGVNNVLDALGNDPLDDVY